MSNNEKPDQLQEQLLPGNNLSKIYKITKNELIDLFQKRFDPTKAENIEQADRLLEDQGGIDGIIKKLATDANSGIIGDERDLERRVRMFDQNSVPLPNQTSFVASFLDVVTERMWIIAAITALLSAIGGIIQTGAIEGSLEGICLLLFAAVIIAIISLVDYIKDNRYIKLQEILKNEKISVIRGKAFQTRSISVWDLVVGDVILLEAGSRVPADCLVVDQESLKVEEYSSAQDLSSSMVDRMEIGDKKFLKAGSIIISGNCKALVCVVGKNSTRGAADKKMDLSKDTVLQHKLSNLSSQLSVIALVASAIIFTQLVIFLFIDMGTNENAWSTFFGKLPQVFNLAVVFAIASIPEGLPLVIQLSLAFSIMKMYEQDKVLVRDLEAPETMGQIEEILVGKTGTLTKAEMKVAHFTVEGTQRVNSRKNTILNCEISDYNLEKLKESILYNSNARIETDATSYVANGNPTDTCMINFLQDADIPVHLMVQRKFGGRLLAERGFGATKRTSVVAVENFDDSETVTIYLKGAPEDVIEMSPNLQIHDNDEPQGDEHKENSLREVEELAKKGFRVICYAFHEISKDTFYETLGGEDCEERDQVFAQQIEEGAFEFRLLATFALKDKLRQTAASAVSYATHDAGLRVRLVSNDHIETAKAVALKSGILTASDLSKSNAVMLGSDFAARVGTMEEGQAFDGEGGTYNQLTNMEDFKEILRDLKVLARAEPEHKKLLVIGLKACGIKVENAFDGVKKDKKKQAILRDMQCKVSVTGEGVNDVEALKEAQVGLAMGTGCSAAKDSSQIVLTDNNFQACLQAVLWGRNIFQNVTRFLQFQMTVNLSMILTVFMGIFFYAESPLSAAQLLWINLIMDSLAALSLATEPPMATIVKGDPKNQTSLLKQKHIWRQIIGVSVFNGLVMLMIFIFGPLIVNSQVYDGFVSTSYTQPEGCDSYPSVATPEMLAKDDCKLYYQSSTKLHILTIAFNVFVFLQLFNMINCRKVGIDDKQVFERFHHNIFFLIILIGVFVTQICLVQYFPVLIRAIPMGSRSEWGGCIAIGATELLIALLLKYTPQKWVDSLPTDRFGINEDEQLASGTMQGKALSAYNKAMGQPDSVDEPEEEETEEVALNPTDEDEETEPHPDGYTRA